MKGWKKSSQVFSDAESMAIKAWRPIIWLIIGQLILTVLIYYSAIGIGDVSSEMTGFRIYLYRFFEFIVVTLYQVFWTVAIIRILKKPDNVSCAQVCSKDLWNKFLPALLISVIVSIVVLVASFFLVIPGVILGVWWAFAIYALVLGDYSVIQSLKRSRELVKGWWWPVFSRMVYVFTMALIVSLFSMIPAFGAFLSGMLSLVFVPIVIIYMGLTYQELVEVKSGKGEVKNSMTVAGKAVTVVWAIVVLGLLSVVTAIGDFVGSVSASGV